MVFSSPRSLHFSASSMATRMAWLLSGAGYGSYGSYRYYVTRTGEGRNMAVFLDGYQQLRSMGSAGPGSGCSAKSCH